MPGVRSADSHLRRQERAIDRGFITPRPRHGYGWIEVPMELAGRARTMVKSLEVHAQHNRAIPAPKHFARDAALQAPLAAEQCLQALRLHRQANRAKHSWRPAHSTPSSVASTKASTQSSTQAAPDAAPPVLQCGGSDRNSETINLA